MWNWHGGSWGWIWMAVAMAGFWAAVGFGIVALSRGSRRGGRQSQPREGKVIPEDVLAERFARGEIDVDEYERRFKVLGGRRRP